MTDSTATAARRYCSDFWRQWGLPERCCQSCHEDRDMGYELIDPPDGSPGEVCCWVIHEWERLLNGGSTGESDVPTD